MKVPLLIITQSVRHPTSCQSESTKPQLHWRIQFNSLMLQHSSSPVLRYDNRWLNRQSQLHTQQSNAAELLVKACGETTTACHAMLAISVGGSAENGVECITQFFPRIHRTRGYFSASFWDVFPAFVFWLLYWLYCFFGLSVCLSVNKDYHHRTKNSLLLMSHHFKPFVELSSDLQIYHQHRSKKQRQPFLYERQSEKRGSQTHPATGCRFNSTCSFFPIFFYFEHFFYFCL